MKIVSVFYILLNSMFVLLKVLCIYTVKIVKAIIIFNFFTILCLEQLQIDDHLV